MKTLWRLLSILAVANLLALSAFVGWLWQTGRMNEQRFELLKSILASTTDEDAARLEEEKVIGAEAMRVAAEERKLLEAPFTREEQVAAAERFEERAQLAMKTLNDEQARLAGKIDEREGAVAEREGALDARREAWEQAIADEKQRETSEQFKKAVKLLEGLPPKQAKDWILELVGSGKIEQAVKYLDAMSATKSANLLKSFKTAAETKSATDLVERLRVLGLESETQAAAKPTAQPKPRTPPKEVAPAAATPAAPAPTPAVNAPVSVK
jgi:hypothetical protein